MTTLCYHKGELAWDSRVTAGNIIQKDNAQKRVLYKGVHFVLCGSVPEFPAFMQAYVEGIGGANLSVSAFCVHPDGLYRASTDETGIWRTKLSYNDVAALGSGMEFAIAAVDCGKTPREAIKVAAKRDNCTGGLVRTMSIPRWK